MAIDFDEVFKTAEKIQEKTDELVEITRLARIAAVVVERVGTFHFTVAQKTALKSKYDSLKAEITILWQLLP